MPDRRRHLFARGLSAALGVVAAAAVGSAQQLPPQSDSRVTLTDSGTLTGDQIKQALGQLGGLIDLPPDMLAQIRERVGRVYPPEMIDAISRRMLRDPELMKQLRQKAREQAGKAGPGGSKTTLPPDFDNLIRRHAQNPGEKNGTGTGPFLPSGQPTQPGGKRTGPSRGLDEPGPPAVNNAGPGDDGGPSPNPSPPERQRNNPGGVPQKNPFQPNTGGLQPPANPATPPDVALAPPEADEPPRAKAMRAAAGLWERNVGPLDETPAVKQILLDVVEATGDLKDGEGNNFWESLGKEAGEATSFSDFLNGAAGGAENWSMPRLELPSLGPGGGGGPTLPEVGGGGGWWERNFGGRPRTPSVDGPSGGLGIDFGIPGMEGSWLPVVLLAAVLLGALVWWRFWLLKDDRAAPAAAFGGLGAWPVDPRRITTRADVTRAFEYLSVLVCGPAAKTWTHNTIARALADLAETHGEAAVMLARLYELARYTPADEPLTTAELAEARRLVCRLAGLDAE
ncbi:MAG: hypothetical protein K2X87_21435 [Gemmataceae bacterium]|nr:hypothetical protein [Gemmataceae bacterium]